MRLKGTIPPGISVPVHSHRDIEAFFVLSGNVEVRSEEDGTARWIAVVPGDFIQVPSNAKEHPGIDSNVRSLKRSETL